MIDASGNAAESKRRNIERRNGAGSSRSDEGLRVERRLDAGVWQEYVARHPQGNIFHTPEMFSTLAQVRGYRPSLWAVLDNADRTAALFTPVEIALAGGPLHRFTARGVAYGSVLAEPGELGERALSLLFKAYQREIGGSVLLTELRHLSDTTNIRAALHRCGFEHEDHLNYLIDLRQPREAIWRRVSSRTRSYIRKAQREGELTVVEVDSLERLHDAYALLRKTYAHAQVPLADYSLFHAIFTTLCPISLAHITSVYLHDVPVATSVDLLYKGVVYYWYGGMDRAYGAHHPNELLRWSVIEWGIDHGFTLFDFGGAGKPGEEYRVRDFKAKFGGELVNLGRDVYVHAPRRLRLSKLGYAMYRRFSPA